MARFGRADEIIVADLKFGPKVLETGRQIVAMRFGRQAAFLRRLLDLLPVLVQAGQEKNIIPEGAVEPCQHVGEYRCVRVADMRRVIHVIDRRCYEEFTLCHPRRLQVLGSSF